MIRQLYTAATLTLLIMAAGCGGAKKEETAEKPAAGTGGATFKVDPATAGTITGKVTFTGTAPPMKPIVMDAEPDCKKLHSAPVKSEEVVVNPNGTLSYVFVYVKTGLE